jgi:hypothetical protein
MGLSREIETAVKDFNRLLPFPAVDFVLLKAFQINPENRDEREGILSMRMEAIDYLFETGLRRKKVNPKDRNVIVKSDFNQFYWELVEQRKKNGPYQLIENTKNQIKADFEHALKILESKTGMNFPAFTSKFLHWTFPDAFPMLDTESLRTMRLGHESDYGSVTDYYLKLADKLQMKTSDLKKQLVEIDFESLPRGLKARYSWVRVVDKWLWLRGKQNEI